MTANLMLEAKRLHQEGLGYKRIARALGCPISTVRWWIVGTQKANASRRRRNGS